MRRENKVKVQIVEHYQINSRYRIKIERAASTKGVLGYTIEANGDTMGDVLLNIEYMKNNIEGLTPIAAPATEVKEGK
jgi:hypothetical protein